MLSKVKWLFLNIFKKGIRIGFGSYIPFTSEMNNSFGGSIRIGKNCDIHKNTIFNTYGGKIRIGSNCSFNPFCVIYGHGGLKIGNDVRIATQTVIIPANHSFDDIEKRICDQVETRKGIIIEDDVWIGSGVKILDGVTIGKGSVIGAGSVVTKNIPEYSVAVGVPVKIIKKRK